MDIPFRQCMTSLRTAVQKGVLTTKDQIRAACLNRSGLKGGFLNNGEALDFAEVLIQEFKIGD